MQFHLSAPAQSLLICNLLTEIVDSRDRVKAGADAEPGPRTKVLDKPHKTELKDLVRVPGNFYR
jgi:hypothetical protein